MHRLQPVAHVRQRARHDRGQRVGQIALAERVGEIDVADLANNGGIGHAYETSYLLAADHNMNIAEQRAVACARPAARAPRAAAPPCGSSRWCSRKCPVRSQPGDDVGGSWPACPAATETGAAAVACPYMGRRPRATRRGRCAARHRRDPGSCRSPRSAPDRDRTRPRRAGRIPRRHRPRPNRLSIRLSIRGPSAAPRTRRGNPDAVPARAVPRAAARLRH